MYADILSQLHLVGQDLFQRGLVSSHAGNLSVRLRDKVIITRHGAMLGHLTLVDLVEVPVEGPEEPKASSDLAIHRAIYSATPACAVVHAHPPNALALSFFAAELVPSTFEASYLLGVVPVLGPVAEHVGDTVSGALKDRKIAMLIGHGSYARGTCLEDAYQWTSALEEDSRVGVMVRSMGGGLGGPV